MVSTMHVIVIIGIFISLFVYEQYKQSFVSILGNNASNPIFFYFIVFGIFIFYVLFMGLLSTFISINNNLEEINSKLTNKPNL